jgi:ATP-dependent RNA helicase RhlE
LSFDNLGLEPRLLQAVESMGYTTPTPIQRDAIPFALAGRDVVGCAQTGTGKTVAFMLPIMQRIVPSPGAPRALVVTPTRELAVQIEEVAKQASEFTRHRVAVVYGGVGYEPQLKALRRGVDVVVGTPGRLLDLQEKGELVLSAIEILVLDEADRMLDMGFWPQVRRIISHVPDKRQNLLFSATMSSDVMRIIGSTLDNPERVEVALANTTADNVEQRVYPVGGQQKLDLLVQLIKDDIRGAAIHGNRTQAQRQKALDGFKAGHYNVLVATDIVARGIDIDNISHVVNFDMPNSPEDYVHRIGRTARAGNSGTAVSLLAPEEHETLRDIEPMLGSILECHDVEGFEYANDRLVPNPEREAKRVVRTVYSGGVMSRRGGRGRR